MLLSLKWLREFVPYQGTAEELGERLTMLGLELEGLERPFADISSLVIGKVVECDNHPDSDHLHVCKVDAGLGELLQIVCGAPNVAAGQLAPVALVGSTLPGGLVIKKAKLRGVESCGMICSERELGLSEEHSGILVLPESNRHGQPLLPGQNFVQALDLDEEVLDISITPNRADCLSVLGFAREVAAAYDLPLTMPSFNLVESGQDCSGEVPIEISDPELCPAYSGRIIENALTAPSPLWLRYRLHAVGVRAISNLVDVTNYVLMELGQPLHAFDKDKLEGGKIIVSPATEGESLTTLDGQARKLKAGDILIRDAVRPVALGGVMGGLETEISADSKSVFLECATFKPGSIRRTARRLGISSEASYRYERGIDQTGMAFALDRAAALMGELSGGTVRKGVCKSEPLPWVSPKTSFRVKRAEALLGVELTQDFCAKVLENLGCKIENKDQDIWTVTAPGWRRDDLSREADLIEEIARYWGVDSIPAVLPRLAMPMERFGRPEGLFAFLFRLRRWAAGKGLNEAVNYSFVGNKDLDAFGLAQEGRVCIVNPLTSEQDVLRTELAPGLLNSLRQNVGGGSHSLHLFELARTFRQDPNSDTSVGETNRLALLLYGQRHEQAWPYAQPNNPEDLDYTDLKGLAEVFFEDFLRLPLPQLVMDDQHPYLAPCVNLVLPKASRDDALYGPEAGQIVGKLGRLKPEIADLYNARKDVWLADFDLDTLRAVSARVKIQARPLPVYPPVRRDVTFITEKSANLRIETIEQAVMAVNSPLLEGVELIDIYEHNDKRNLTFRLTFRSASRTLKDAEADKQRESVVKALVQSLPLSV